MTITRDTHDGDSAGLTWDAVPPAAMDGLGSDGGGGPVKNGAIKSQFQPENTGETDQPTGTTETHLELFPGGFLTPNPQISIHSQVAEKEGRTYRWTGQETFPRHTLDC
ncbi:unnamed protein product [Boreogadus saida]